MMTPFIQGFGSGGGLIVAIGAQNAFVLSQSVQGNHHLIVALVCILCDAIFISLGIGGIGAFIEAIPGLSIWVSWGGAGFLFFYGCCSLYSAIKGGSLESSNQSVRSTGAVVLTTLAVTLLNPHFYLDTVVLLGSISSHFNEEKRILFWAGAVTASTLWFLSLSLGCRILAPLFKKQLSWRILDTMVWGTMWSIALSLLLQGDTK